MPVPPVETELDRKIFLTVLRHAIPSVTRLDDERLVKKIGNDRFADSCDELFGFIESGTDSSLTRLEKDALASKIVDCLKAYIKEQMQLPFTLKTLFDCFGLLTEAVDRAFPNYYQSKLLKYTIK